MHETKQFLDHLHKGGVTHFRCLKAGQQPQTVVGRYDSDIEQQLREINHEGFDVYFVVNSGGFREEDITKVKAVFVDLDCGRDANRQYFPMEEVEVYKRDKQLELLRWAHPPSYIVETRNGLHAYWILRHGATPKQFTACIARLIARFRADPTCSNINRLMRVPGFNWYKASSEVFPTRIIHQSPATYDVDTLIRTLREHESSTGGLLATKRRDTFFVDREVLPLIDPIREMDVGVLRQRVGCGGETVASPKELSDWLRKQNLSEFLGIPNPKRFSCLFHEDRAPSAGIVVNKHTGHHIYVCQSSNCKVKGTIIQLTERIAGIQRYEAINFLRQVYNIDIRHTAWQIEQLTILDQNLSLINSDEFPEVYPALYKRLRRYVGNLNHLHAMAKDNLTTHSNTDPDGYPIFTASTRYLATAWGRHLKTVCKILALFTYLGILRKLDDHSIPDDVLRNARREAATSGRPENIQTHFSIPPYGEHTFQFSTNRAKEFTNKGFTMTGFTWEMLLLSEGDGEAQRVYPQMSHKAIPQKNGQLAANIEVELLSQISERGWTTERDIVLGVCSGKRRKYVEEYLKRVLPSLVGKYGLTREYLNKDLKDKLHIDVKGWPIVIYTRNGAM